MSARSPKSEYPAALSFVGFVKLAYRPLDVGPENGAAHAVVTPRSAADSRGPNGRTLDCNLDIINPRNALGHTSISQVVPGSNRRLIRSVGKPCREIFALTNALSMKQHTRCIAITARRDGSTPNPRSGFLHERLGGRSPFSLDRRR